jgi:hypothetical protein
MVIMNNNVILFYILYTMYIFTLLRQTNKYALFIITCLYQCHRYMFRWSSHHHRGAPNVIGSILHLKSVTFGAPQ